MPRGAKGQRELLSVILDMTAKNPGISAADLAKMAEKKLIEDGITKPTYTLSENALKAITEILVPETKEKSVQILISPGIENGYKVRRKLSPKAKKEKAEKAKK